MLLGFKLQSGMFVPAGAQEVECVVHSSEGQQIHLWLCLLELVGFLLLAFQFACLNQLDFT